MKNRLRVLRAEKGWSQAERVWNGAHSAGLNRSLGRMRGAADMKRV